jgi:cytochrome b561
MGDPSVFGWFKVTGFVNTPVYEMLVTNWMGTTFEEFEKPIDWFHKVLAGTYLFWMLFVIHVAAGLYHHFGKRDRTLVRMLPDGWLKNPRS